MRKIREPLNFFTHVVPALLAIPATWILVQSAENAIQSTAAWIYGLNGILLFSVSAIYHGFPSTDKGIRFWQKFDHCCIYLMIAGSYTPTSLLVFNGYVKWSLFSIVWLIAIIGCVLKIFNRLQHPAISLTIYILMGCLIIPLLSRMSEVLPYSAILWMLLGGVFYIGGTIFYFKDKPLGRYFHSHEIWHIFVIGGAVSHYVYNYFYLFT